MSLHRTLAAMGMALAVGLSSSASAQDAVLSGVAVRVNPGQMDAYLSRVKKLQGAMDRLESGGHIEAWQATAAGTTTGTTFVGLEFESLVAYAESSVKTRADDEFQKLISGLDELRTVESSSLYRQISGPSRLGDVPTGSVLQTVSVRVEPGRLDDYTDMIEKLRAISKRLGTSNTIRVWHATAAGEATGTVVIGVLHKDLNAYAADSTKTRADAEWQKLVAGLDDMRTIVSSSLSRNTGP